MITNKSYRNDTPVSNERNGELVSEQPLRSFRDRTASSASASIALAGLVDGMNGVGAGSGRGSDEEGDFTGDASGMDYKGQRSAGEQDASGGITARAGAVRRAMPTGEKAPRSCDVCRQRKIKCVRPEDSDGNGSSRCQGCHALDIDCTYKHVARKPGRPNSFAKRLYANGEAGGERTTSNSSGVVRGTGGIYQNSKTEGSDRLTPSLPPRETSFEGMGAAATAVPLPIPSKVRHQAKNPTVSGNHDFNQPQLSSSIHFAPDPWLPPQANGFGQPIAFGIGLSPPRMNDGPITTSAATSLRPLGLLDSIFNSPSSSGSATALVSGVAHRNASNLFNGDSRRENAGMVEAENGIVPSARASDQDFDFEDTSRAGPEYMVEDTLGPLPGRWNDGQRIDGGGGLLTASQGNGQDTQIPPPHHSVSFATNHDIVPLGRIQASTQTGTTGSNSRGTFPLPPTLSQRSLTNPQRGTVESSSVDTGPSSATIEPLHHNYHPFKHIQLEDVTSWATISFFVSLYLRHFHCLVPLVHIPTFTNAIAMRQDREDVDFRAFLLSLVCYLISQSPKSRMIDHFSQSELERLQSRCHRASRLLQSRSYKVPSRLNIITLMFDYFYSASAGKTAQATAALSEAISLAYFMGLHDDERTAQFGLDEVERQMRRRTFWLLYAISVTEASAGFPIGMHEYEGVCTYPEEVDDDLITAAGLFRQPTFRTSLLVGFVTIMRLFRIHAECIIRHRKYLRIPGASGPSTVQDSLDWIQNAQDGIQRILEGLPPALLGPERAYQLSPSDSANAEVFGTERANILITAASVQFSLYDFKSVLDVNGDHGSDEQEAVSRSIIPLDHLAANGESMRGKVLRIIAALLGRSSTPGEELSSSVKDWYEMFSLIGFVQVIPRPLESRMPSREGSPATAKPRMG